MVAGVAVNCKVFKLPVVRFVNASMVSMKSKATNLVLDFLGILELGLMNSDLEGGLIFRLQQKEDGRSGFSHAIAR
ncbi:hypothetical protein L2E82_38802 [Cichorium intybus]|uniref:Uncharacterized protein n=1 Tax=Cichorium intybus TaxID=13427 RepID=A0ACB9AFZ4_CICIN|nr:hypothetical protein L2E82_38802 [Cichorium intybus]